MSADVELMKAVTAADLAHSQACKCKTTARLYGADGPHFATFAAAWRVAEALAEEFDALPHEVAAKGARTAELLGIYREVRRGQR